MNSSSHIPPRPVIALLTDFGLDDGYGGILKGVMLGIAPNAQLIDITHTIAPQQVASGAWILATSYRYFPSGTVFACIVDPGVGSMRRPLALHAGDWFFIGPDNGLLSYVLQEQAVHAVVTLSNSTYQLPHRSATFHGRDIFAPAAAHLAAGVALHDLGPLIDPAMLHRLTIREAARSESTVTGRVTHIDTYGNIITNIPHALVPDLYSSPHVQLEFPLQHAIVTQRRHFFSEHLSEHGPSETPDTPFLYIDSSNYIGVAINGGNAAQRLNIGYDATVTFVLSGHNS